MTMNDPLDRTRLMYACADGDLANAQSFIAAGDDVNIREANGWTAMHFAAQLQDAQLATELMKALYEAGAEIDPQQMHGNTPLHRATFAARENGAAILFLLKHGADKSIENNSGISPLNLAQSVGNFDLVRFFN